MLSKKFLLISSMTILFMIRSVTQALICFETNEDGDMIEISNENFTYCVLSPEHMEENEFIHGNAFGVGPKNDPTGVYDNIFKSNNGKYTILSMCIYEKYDFGKMFPKLSFMEPEFMLRCFCNFDKCNREKNFFEYINSLKVRSAISLAKIV